MHVNAPNTASTYVFAAVCISSNYRNTTAMAASNSLGWATWRRAWLLYDYKMKLWQMPDAQKAVHKISITNYLWKRRKMTYSKIMMHEGGEVLGGWEFQWTFCRFINSGLTNTPAKKSDTTYWF